MLCLFVIHIALFRYARGSIIVVILLGYVMDNLSGGTFGLYITTYFWLFVGIRWVLKFLHMDYKIFLPGVVALGVLIENFIFLGLAMMEKGFWFSPGTIKVITIQVLWAIFTGPFFLMFLNYTHDKWDKWLSELIVKKDEYA
jgi:hypothetical protein